MFNQWRRFQFFDKELVTGEDGKGPNPELQGLQINSAAAGKGQTVFGDDEGRINLCDRKFNLTRFQGFEAKVSKVFQQQQQNILIAVGEDHGQSAVVKVWDLDRTDESGLGFKVLLSRDVFEGLSIQRSTATCLAAAEDLSLIAVGLSSGVIVLFQGDIIHGKGGGFRVSSRVLSTGKSSPIVSITVCFSSGQQTWAMVATASQVLCFHDLSQGSMEVLDELGASPGAVTYTDAHEMVVGRQEALYCFNREGRGATYAFEGNKKLLACMREYLLVVTADKPPMNTVTVYDMKNKLVAFSAAVQDVRFVVCEWGNIIMPCGDGKFWQLTEKDTQTKLDMLFKRNLYTVAINLAQMQKLDETYIVDIQRKYGDHLYSKSDYDGAMGQYLQTVGKLEPSYVIRKFLDAQRIHNLTSYLHTLHQRKLANAEHTTLLLNCYTKLKDVQRLDDFIRSDGLSLEPNAAVATLRNAGYYEHALYLAKQHQEHTLCVKIQVLDLSLYGQALDYIASLSQAKAMPCIKFYGSELMAQLPDQTTGLLKTLCTPSDEDSEESRASAAAQEAMEFVHLFEGQRACLIDFLENIAKVNPSAPNGVYNTLLELYLNQDTDGERGSRPSSVGSSSGLSVPDPAAAPALPSTPAKSISKEEGAKRALDLLRTSTGKIDEAWAMLLCQMHDLDEGVVLLLERQGLYRDVLEHYMTINDPEKVISACSRWGETDGHLWISALHWFASLEVLHEDKIQIILEHIEKGDLVPPLVVVQTLSQHNKATLALVKGYMTRSLQREMAGIQEDREVIRSFQEETERMRNEMEELRTTAKVFQSRNCALCGQELDLPSVHFMCSFEGTPCSFHKRCLGDNEKECPLCGPEAQRVKEMAQSISAPTQNNQEVHENFFRQLNVNSSSADQRFVTIAEHFSRGLFNAAG